MSVGEVADRDSLSANIRNVNMRLIRATPDFSDRLGPSLLTGSLSARRDEPGAQALDALAVRLASTLPSRSRLAAR